MKKMMLNPDKEWVRTLRRRLKDNAGYCPCQLEKNADTKCPCKTFREEGQCDCGLYVPAEPVEYEINL